MRSRRRQVSLVLLALAALACTTDRGDSTGGFTRVTSAELDSLVLRRALADLPEPRVADTITLTGAAEDLFGRNPQIVVPLRDGRTLLSEGQTLAVFERDGSYAGTWASQGRGPGEILSFGSVWQDPGDSLWVLDIGNRRISVYAPDLSYARSLPIGAMREGMSWYPWIGLGGDTLAAFRPQYADWSAPPGRYVIQAGFGAWVLGQPEATISRERPSYETAILPAGVLPEPAFGVPFSGNFQWRPLGRCMVYGFSDAWSLTIEALDSALALRTLAVVTVPDEPARAVDDAQREAYIRGLTGNSVNAERSAMWERALREHIPFAEQLPHFGRVLTGRDGSIWVQRYRGPSTDVPDHWTILDAANLRAWRLSVPPRSRLLAVDSARAFIATADADDVETQHWWLLPELDGIQPPEGCRVN